MKLKSKTFGIQSSAFLYFLLLCLGLTLTRCEADSDLKLNLAVNSNEIVLKPEGGSTHIMVYSTGKWSVAFQEPVKWASVDKLQGEGNSSILFSYSENLEAARRVTLLLTKDDIVQEIVLIQDGTNPSLRLPNSIEVAKEALPIQLSLTTNLIYTKDELEYKVLYDDELSEEWITEVEVTDEGVRFKTLANDLGVDRTAKFTLFLIDGHEKEFSASTTVKQTTEGVFLTPDKESSKVTKSASTEVVTFTTNLGYSFPFFTVEVTYQGSSSDWISDIQFANNSLRFEASENETGAVRTAIVSLSLETEEGNIIIQNYLVTQSEQDVTVLPFATLRAKITGASGSYSSFTEYDAIEAVVISDVANPNMETNPKPTYNTADLTESLKTVYIQALDGSYGLRLKLSSAEDNVFSRYTKIKLSLQGLTLTKEANPARYTLTGFSPTNIMESSSGSASSLTAKEKYIGNLTEADIYTFVTLKDIEVSLPYGTWTNTNWGYMGKHPTLNPGGVAGGGYVDAVPTSIRDDRGGHMNVVTNLDAPWSRTDLPKGSGNLKGIVVNTKLVRFAAKGDIGTYSLRVVEEADIALGSTPKSSTLVEWNWVNNGLCAAGTVTKNPDNTIPARIGTGLMSCTTPSAFAATGVGAHPVCNILPGDNSTKAPASAFTFGFTPPADKWYNKTTGKGEGVVLKFSTAGISGSNLTVNFSQGGGSGSAITMAIPTYWHVEYSTDGANYTVLPNSTYSCRPLIGWDLKFLFACPGLQDHSFTLPNSLFNQENVYVRLVVNSDVCGSTTGLTEEDGESGLISTFTGTTKLNLRFGFISFKYNQ